MLSAPSEFEDRTTMTRVGASRALRWIYFSLAAFSPLAGIVGMFDGLAYSHWSLGARIATHLTLACCVSLGWRLGGLPLGKRINALALFAVVLLPTVAFL